MTLKTLEKLAHLATIIGVMSAVIALGLSIREQTKVVEQYERQMLILAEAFWGANEDIQNQTILREIVAVLEDRKEGIKIQELYEIIKEQHPEIKDHTFREALHKAEGQRFIFDAADLPPVNAKRERVLRINPDYILR